MGWRVESEAIHLCEAMKKMPSIKEVSEEGTKIIGKIDSQTLEEAIKSISGVSNRKFRKDIAALKGMLERGDIKKIEWREVKDEVADGLTKEEGVINHVSEEESMTEGSFLVFTEK